MAEPPNFDCEICVSTEFHDKCCKCFPNKYLCLQCFTSHKCVYHENVAIPISLNNESNSSSSTFNKPTSTNYDLPTQKRSQQIRSTVKSQSSYLVLKPTLPTHNPPSVRPTLSTHNSPYVRPTLPTHNSSYVRTTSSVRPTTTRPHAHTSSLTQPPKKVSPTSRPLNL